MRVYQLHLSTNGRAGVELVFLHLLYDWSVYKMSASLSNISVQRSAILLLIIVVIILNSGTEANYPDKAFFMVFLRKILRQLALLNTEYDR
jgi:hypothetical protein